MTQGNEIRNELLDKLKDTITIYCQKQEPDNVFLKFKDEKKNKERLIIETLYPIPNDNIRIMFSGMDKDWQTPLFGTYDIGNPKFKIVTREEFDKTFDIISYAVHEKRVIMNLIEAFKINSFKHNGLWKEFHEYAPVSI